MRTLRRIFLSSLLLVSMPWAQAQNSKGGVGILMPTVTSQRWVVDGLAMVRAEAERRGWSVISLRGEPLALCK